MIFEHQNLINAKGGPEPNPAEAQRQHIRFSLLKLGKRGRNLGDGHFHEFLTKNFEN
ncbi:MAG: hypothetical protein WA160_14795 [Pseudobdellovibrio sp.]